MRGNGFDDHNNTTKVSNSEKCDCMERYIDSKIQTIRKYRKFQCNKKVEPMLQKIMDIEIDIFNEFYKNK